MSFQLQLDTQRNMILRAGYDVPSLSRDLDWIAVMCYDYHGQWDKQTGHNAPMFASPNDTDPGFNAVSKLSGKRLLTS